METPGLLETKLISTGVDYTTLPTGYIRPHSDRPNLSQVSESDHVPVVDLACGDRDILVTQIREACSLYGFFQVINHGIPKDVVENMLKVGKEFFNLPMEEKLKLYTEDPSKTVRLSTSFNVTKETVHNWRDYLRLHCYPLDMYMPHWPSNPPSFKDIASRYCKEVRELGFRLEEAISESLGLDKNFLRNSLGEQGQHMAINYYPPCPQPELTYGLPAHTDPNLFTILLQELDVSGLHVLKDTKWIPVKPCPNAFVINMGDQLQAISNGKYKSVWHRAVVNSNKARLSLASFMCPCDDAVIKAPKSLSVQPIYRDFTYAEYYNKFWSKTLDQQHCLQLFENDICHIFNETMFCDDSSVNN